MASPAVPAPPTAPPLQGEVRDVGAMRRDRVRARGYTAFGAVKILGDLEAAAIELQGMATIGGRVLADHLRSDGTLDVAKDVTVKGDCSLKGTTRLSAGLATGDLVVHGHLRVAGSVVVDGDGQVNGFLEAGSNLSARTLRFDGGLHVPGTLECPVIEGRLRRASRIGTLRSQHLRIVRATLPSVAQGSLVVDRIEATEVEIGPVDCEYLRADRVRLGAGAHVTRIDGEVVRRHRTATVGPRSWEPIPPGISR